MLNTQNRILTILINDNKLYNRFHFYLNVLLSDICRYKQYNKINCQLFFHKIQIMGNEQSSHFETEFLGRYNFIQLVEDPNYGLIKVYRKKQINFDYVMVYDQPLSGLSHEEKQQKIAQLKYIRANPHEQILRLFNYRIVQKNAFECKVQVLRYHIEYYNFTLQNLVQVNAKHKIYLDVQEVLFIINSIIQVYKYFQKIKVKWFCIKPSQIFISTQGCLYFSPFKIVNNGYTEDICGCDNTFSTKKVEKLLQEQKKFKDIKNQLKKLILFLTAHYPKEYLENFRELFKIIESSENTAIVQQSLPKANISCIDMQKQTMKLMESESEGSMQKNKTKMSLNFSRTTSKQSQKVSKEEDQKKSLKRYDKKLLTEES